MSNKKDKYISGQIEFEVEDGSMTAEEFSNMFNQSLADQFKRIQNIKSKTHTTISTTVNPREDHAADVMSWFARWKRKEQNAIYGLDTGEGRDQTAWTTFKINTPVLEDISENIDKILGDSDLMKTINELYLRNTQEVYVRELLNRLHKIIDYCDRWKGVDPSMDYIIKLARGEDE